LPAGPGLRCHARFVYGRRRRRQARSGRAGAASHQRPSYDFCSRCNERADFHRFPALFDFWLRAPDFRRAWPLEPSVPISRRIVADSGRNLLGDDRWRRHALRPRCHRLAHDSGWSWPDALGPLLWRIRYAGIRDRARVLGFLLVERPLPLRSPPARPRHRAALYRAFVSIAAADLLQLLRLHALLGDRLCQVDLAYWRFAAGVRVGTVCRVAAPIASGKRDFKFVAGVRPRGIG